MKKFINPALVATTLFGCAMPKWAEPLNEEEQKEVEALVERETYMMPVVRDLLLASNVRFSTTAPNVSEERVVKALEGVHERLQSLHEGGHIVAADSIDETFFTKKAQAMHTPDITDQDWIVLARDAPFGWGTGLLMHEAAHGKGEWHKPKLKKEMKEIDGSFWSRNEHPDFARLVLETHDFSYTMSMFYELLDDAYANGFHIQIDAQNSYVFPPRESWIDRGYDPNSQEAKEHYAQYLAWDIETFTDAVLKKRYGKHDAELWSVFDITREEMREAFINNPEFFEYKKEKEIAGFEEYREAWNEAHGENTEVQTEIIAPTERRLK